MEVDGIEVDERKAADAVRRCILAIMRINEFRPIMGDIPEVVAFVTDIDAILKGEEDAETDER